MYDQVSMKYVHEFRDENELLFDMMSENVNLTTSIFSRLLLLHRLLCEPRVLMIQDRSLE